MGIYTRQTISNYDSVGTSDDGSKNIGNKAEWDDVMRGGLFDPAKDFIEALNTQFVTSFGNAGDVVLGLGGDDFDMSADSGLGAGVLRILFTSNTMSVSEIHFQDLRIENDGTDLWFQLTDTTTTTLQTGATDYKYGWMKVDDNGTLSQGGSSGDSKIILGTGLGNASTEEASGRILIFDPNGTDSNTMVMWDISYRNDVATTRFVNYRGMGTFSSIEKTAAAGLSLSTGTNHTINYQQYDFIR